MWKLVFYFTIHKELAVKNQSHLLTDVQQPSYFNFQMVHSLLLLLGFLAWLLDLQTNYLISAINV